MYKSVLLLNKHASQCENRTRQKKDQSEKLGLCQTKKTKQKPQQKGGNVVASNNQFL